MAIFRFFKDGGRRHLPFYFSYILTVGTVIIKIIQSIKKVELHHCAKFSRNRSNRSRGIAIFGFFKWRPPPSWILKILNFKRSNTSPRRSNCVIVPNFVETAPIADEIWRFFHFSRWRPPPSWISEISKF